MKKVNTEGSSQYLQPQKGGEKSKEIKDMRSIKSMKSVEDGMSDQTAI